MENEGQFDAIEFVRAIENQKLWPGRLLSPDETQRAVAGRQGAERDMSGWFLCATAHPAMFEAYTPLPFTSASLLIRPLGDVTYMLTVQQRGPWQSRIIMPLLGDTTKEFVGSLKGGSDLQLSLASGDGPNALITNLSSTAEFRHSFDEVKFGRARDMQSLAHGLISLVREFLRPEACPSLEQHVGVQHACVTYAIPDGVVSRVSGTDCCNAITAAILQAVPVQETSQLYH